MCVCPGCQVQDNTALHWGVQFLHTQQKSEASLKGTYQEEDPLCGLVCKTEVAQGIVLGGLS